MEARLSASESAPDITPEFKRVRPYWIAGMRHAEPLQSQGDPESICKPVINLTLELTTRRWRRRWAGLDPGVD
jgi:hypothetical protein